MTTVAEVEQTAIGRTVSVGPLVLFVGRLPWSRESDVTLTRQWASVTVRGFYLGVCWR